MEDEKTLFIISSDFCHWGEDFDYTPMNKKYKSNEIYKFITDLDE
jgi:predicted class III extradiol MEMO1 family dioxygenase